MDRGFCHSRLVGRANPGFPERPFLERLRVLCTDLVRIARHVSLAWFSCACLVHTLLPADAWAQAPIRERSEPATGVEGLRRVASTTRNELAAAEARVKSAQAEQKRAEAVYAAAAKELAAARSETERAQAEQAAARAADQEARAALNRALEGKR